MSKTIKRAKKEKLSKHKFFLRYLDLINTFLEGKHRMTLKEMQVLAGFMSIEGDLAESDRFGTQCRKYVRQLLKFKSPANIDNYINYLKNKSIIITDKQSGKLLISPSIQLPKNTAEVELTFNIKKDE